MEELETDGVAANVGAEALADMEGSIGGVTCSGGLGTTLTVAVGEEVGGKVAEGVELSPVFVEGDAEALDWFEAEEFAEPFSEGKGMDSLAETFESRLGLEVEFESTGKSGDESFEELPTFGLELELGFEELTAKASGNGRVKEELESLTEPFKEELAGNGVGLANGVADAVEFDGTF